MIHNIRKFSGIISLFFCWGILIDSSVHFFHSSEVFKTEVEQKEPKFIAYSESESPEILTSLEHYLHKLRNSCQDLDDTGKTQYSSNLEAIATKTLKRISTLKVWFGPITQSLYTNHHFHSFQPSDLQNLSIVLVKRSYILIHCLRC